MSEEDLDMMRLKIEAGNLSNSELLDEVIESSIGDDYDGLFTAFGRIRYDVLFRELENRLIQCGFLDEKAE